MAKLIDGKAIAKSIYDNINLRVRELRSKGVWEMTRHPGYTSTLKKSVPWKTA